MLINEEEWIKLFQLYLRNSDQKPPLLNPDKYPGKQLLQFLRDQEGIKKEFFPQNIFLKLDSKDNNRILFFPHKEISRVLNVSIHKSKITNISYNISIKYRGNTQFGIVLLLTSLSNKHRVFYFANLISWNDSNKQLSYLKECFRFAYFSDLLDEKIRVVFDYLFMMVSPQIANSPTSFLFWFDHFLGQKINIIIVDNAEILQLEQQRLERLTKWLRGFSKRCKQQQIDEIYNGNIDSFHLYQSIVKHSINFSNQVLQDVTSSKLNNNFHLACLQIDFNI